ncbi:LLM class flavin-dependent oxidoreductase [Nocardioides campestrisoli]|uniref:LLM class flavin-dependent oxidoreductase n=1 Tax=Nocardioides campestrisoli TaxID=2736757 RepID=UPI00163D5B89|nr:LLM class flavin-dependent oxidoreductase [Nocardioides campestrisoli]
MELGVACRVREPGPGLAEAVGAAAAAAEELGLASWWVPGDRDSATDGSWDAMLVLQAAARRTSRLRLASTGDLLGLRSPAVRAKQVATLDWLSAGRLDYSLDPGTPPTALVDPFLAPAGEEQPGGDAAQALATSLEHLAVMTALWTQDRAAHEGASIAFEGAIAKPKPRAQGSGAGAVPPVHVRLADPQTLAAYVAGGGRVDGWLAWLTPADELAARAGELAAPVHGTRPRLTWFVPADELPQARARCAELGTGVDELVAVLDHLSTPDDLAALVAAAV